MANVDASMPTIVETEAPKTDTPVLAELQNILAAAINPLGRTMPLESILQEEIPSFAADVCTPNRALVMEKFLTLANQFWLDR